MNVKHSLGADHYLVTHRVGPNESGIRIDAFLKHRYQKKSREQIKRALDTGAITIGRNVPHFQVGKIKPSTSLLYGDEVRVLTEKSPEPEVNFDYKILYEDEALFVINKPSNLPVHPAGKFFFNTLITHLKTQGFTRPLDEDRDFYLVHRIDKETSGVMVLVKEREFSNKLAAQFADRSTEKTYLAITHGRIEKDKFSVDLAIGHDPHAPVNLKQACIPESEGGYPSLTHFKVLERRGNFTLVECTPKTGRQHQIRVHLDAVGHPIVGDKLYGIDQEISLSLFERPVHKSAQTILGSPAYTAAPEISPEVMAKLILPRHALHAHAIRFTHPLTHKKVEFTSPLPEELRAFFESQKV